MALELIGGTLFKLLYDGVKQAMSKSNTFKTLLRDLKSTLDSLVPADIQQIGEQTSNRLESITSEGVKLVRKLSQFRMWNYYCCLDNYTDQIVELDRALKRLLAKLKMQEARDVKEVLVLARQNQDKLDEVNRRLLDIHKLLQQQMAGYVMENLVSGSNTETVPEQTQGNGAEQVATLDRGAALGATFAELWDAVIKAKDKTIIFKPLLENLKLTLDSLRPLMEEISTYNKVLDRPKEEFENMQIQMNKGVELVHKSSKVVHVWTSCKNKKYHDKLLGLDQCLQTLVSLLKVQVATYVRETCVSISNIEAVVKRIEESGVLQNQTPTQTLTQGLCALLEPLLRTTGLDILNEQGTKDVRETSVLVRNTKAGIEQIEGSGAVQNQIEIKVVSEASGAGSNIMRGSDPGVYVNLEDPRHGREAGFVKFTMDEILKATQNFSPSLKIGQGGFGTVYKGRLEDGTFVAIKRAKKRVYDKYLGAEFQSEIRMLAQVEHMNLVKFYGCLEHKDEKIVVVEYVPNGTLREHLDCLRGVDLDLAVRLDVAIDVAQAVTYLHMYTDHPIIHRDIKSSNILITENFRAKVADYGFARFAADSDSGATHVSTQVKGTAGYLDPEYLRTYQLTEKSDVYSFGVLLVELVTGRRPIEPKRKINERVTVRWAMKKFTDGDALSVLDPRLEQTAANNSAIERILELTLQCLAPHRENRPSMKRCAEILWRIRKDYREVSAPDFRSFPSRSQMST